MGNSYSTLEGAQVSLGRLTAEERRFLGQMIGRFKRGGSYLDFENLYMDPDSTVFHHALRLGKPVAETPLYHVCDDLARRLGIRQGHLVKEQVLRYSEPEAAERRELTPGESADSRLSGTKTPKRFPRRGARNAAAGALTRKAPAT